MLKQPLNKKINDRVAPAAFGRLCVETRAEVWVVAGVATSRLRAAVC